MAKKKINIQSHFLDSGAFTLWKIALKYHQDNNCGRWDYYDTPEFWEYMDKYVAFVKKYKKGIDIYANVDVIPNAELTWRNQKYLEEQGINPIPIVHYGTDLKWLHKYINAGYKMIGIGGLAKSVHASGTISFLDRCFDIICNTPDRLPKIKVHGFGISSVKLWLRYPWWSIDSTSIHKKSGFGWILVPYFKNGEWRYDKPPLHVSVSNKSPFVKNKGKHLFTLTPKEKEVMLSWLNFINIPLGNKKEEGVINNGTMRKLALFFYYKYMSESLPEWPWPFPKIGRESLI